MQSLTINWRTVYSGPATGADHVIDQLHREGVRIYRVYPVMIPANDSVNRVWRVDVEEE